MRVVGRMRPGVTIAEARRRRRRGGPRDQPTDRIGPRVHDRGAAGRRCAGGEGGAAGAVRAASRILLTIACVNVASLLIARAAARARETALRLALGRQPLRLLRQSLVEGLMLTLLGAAAGTVVGFAGLRVLIALAPESLARIGAARIDGTVLAFTLGISLAWGLLFSLAPGDRVVPSRRSQSAAANCERARPLVVVQIALSLVLLIGAGLLARAFVELQRVDPGFRADGA